jgi:chromosome segregation ATPase
MSSLLDLAAQHKDAQEMAEICLSGAGRAQQEYTSERMSLFSMLAEHHEAKKSLMAQKESLEKRLASITEELSTVSAQIVSQAAEAAAREAPLRLSVEQNLSAWNGAKRAYESAQARENELKIHLDFAKASETHEAFLACCAKARGGCPSAEEAQGSGQAREALLLIAQEEVRKEKERLDRNRDDVSRAGDECESLNVLLENARHHLENLDGELAQRQQQLKGLGDECAALQRAMYGDGLYVWRLDKRSERDDAERKFKANKALMDKIQSHVALSAEEYDKTQAIIAKLDKSVESAKKVLMGYCEKIDPLDRAYRAAMMKLQDVTDSS